MEAFQGCFYAQERLLQIEILIMKKFPPILLILLCCSVAYPQEAKEMHQHKKETRQQPASYTCPMHPEIHSPEPGDCPKCGMPLVKEKPKGSAVRKHNMQSTDSSEHGMHNMDGHDMPMSAEATYTSFEKNFLSNNNPPRVVRYDLYVRDTMVNFSGKTKRAIAVNGQLPMPTLTFTEGDTAEIYVHNNLNEETALHWHGLHLPNQYDGVPYLTQMPIKPHTSFLYRFPIVQSGTHFYHSHSMFQEQIGMYGMFIMNKRKEWDIPTLPVVLSEWSDMKPEQIDRRLHNASDWFAIQKGTTQSYAEAISSGHFKTKLTNEWKRMHAMDVSDVYYNTFLVNGKKEMDYSGFKAGDKVRLRIANGGASNYYWLTYSGGKITVVASDGLDVQPVEVDRLLIAVSETYDVVLTVPDEKKYEFLITPEDRTGIASIWLGSGQKVPATRLPKLKYFAGMKMMNDMMDMRGNLIEMQGMKMQNQEMDMNTVMYPEIMGASPHAESMQHGDMHEMKPDHTMPAKGEEMQMQNDQHNMAGMKMELSTGDLVTLNYGMLRAADKTVLPPGPLRELKFDLTGNMNRYVWSLDNKTLSETDKVLIKKGENVRIIMYNNSMMRHPMHLHGHDFRILNKQGDYAPLKNVIDIMPMERDTIEFAANADGDWFFHCHILYHMMSGMGRVLSYENSAPNPQMPYPAGAFRKLKSVDRKFHFMADVGLQSNGSDGAFSLANTRYKFAQTWHLGYQDKHGYESETTFGRYLGRMQWWFPYIGYDYHYKKPGGPKNIFGDGEKNLLGQQSNSENRHTAVAGIAYTLPMLFIADARVDLQGKFRFQLSREDIPVSSRLRLNLMVNTDKEYAAGLRYIATKSFSLGTHYDSDMGLGAGVIFTY